MQTKQEKNNKKNDFFSKKLAAHPCEAKTSNLLTKKIHKPKPKN